MIMHDEDIAIKHALAAADHYKLLLISRDAPQDQIKRGYLRLSRKLHPDKANAERHRAEAAFKRLTEAYTTLSDPLLRAHYDKDLMQEAEMEEQLLRDFEAYEAKRSAEEKEEKVERLKMQGDAAATEGRASDAIDAYTRAIALDPNKANLFSNRAAAYLSLDMCLEALADAESGLKIRGGWAKLYCRKATALDGLRRYGEAVTAWRAAVDAEDQTGTPAEGWAESLRQSEQSLVAEVEQLRRQADDAATDGRIIQAVRSYKQAIKMALEPLSPNAVEARLDRVP